MKKIVYFLAILLPWSIRRRLLVHLLGFDIHPTARIGISWILPKRLIMEAHSAIGHLTVCKGMELVQLSPYATVGRANWITGAPATTSGHYSHETNRRSVLMVGEHSAITNRHLIDCTNEVKIGRFSTLAGFQSQILTHSIELEENRQSSKPVTIGDYCFVGTNVVILGGAALPSYSVLGAKSLLNKAFTEPYMLYGGVPAMPVKTMAKDLGYFHRAVGFVL